MTDNHSLLMCPPEYFQVNYAINPWMENHINQSRQDVSQKQWNKFYSELSLLTDVSLITPESHVPDLVFTANAALTKNKRCILSRFRHKERQLEERIFYEWFNSKGYQIHLLPDHIYFEGEGDALFQPDEDILWMGYGIRSDIKAEPYVADFFNVTILPLELVNPNFYHLDTCLCPLLDGYLLYYPQAFSDTAQKTIHKTIPSDKQIIISEEDALNFSCNTLLLPKEKTKHERNILFMNNPSTTLTETLNNLGYDTIRCPTNEFMKSGGANKCLVLYLD